jgi:hypothetical protein
MSALASSFGIFASHRRPEPASAYDASGAPGLARNGDVPRIIAAGYPPTQEPPDFDITTDTGKLWGVEITELVSQKAIEETQKGNSVYAEWSDDDLIDEFRELVLRKDRPENIKGGPYDRYVLLVHTDETFLLINRLRKLLVPLPLVTSLISDIYVLFSYDPKMGHEPLLHLQVVKNVLRPETDVGSF